MKLLVLVFALMASTNAFAKTINLNCVRATEGDLLEEKNLSISLSESEIKFQADFFGKTETVRGKFTRTAKNGSAIYEGGDLTALVDQADLGYIFVDQSLLAGRAGSIGFSVRQLGDSEGFSWINDKFKCKAAN